ncbi:MAG: hypothetical protein ACI38A_07550 [Candidatus Ornithomonoglobus sp.]
MLRIEDVSTDKKYSLSLCFNRNYTKEKLLFGEEPQKQKYFSNENPNEYGIVNKNRTFGATMIEAVQLSESEDYFTLMTMTGEIAEGIINIPEHGLVSFNADYYKQELFRMYNTTENLLERYIVIRLWYALRLILEQTRPVDFYASDSIHKNWSRIGEAYLSFADNMLAFFDCECLSGNKTERYSGRIRIDSPDADNNTYCHIFTDDRDVSVLLSMYRNKLLHQGKLIHYCDVCGSAFIASRSNESVCSDNCRNVRQSIYFRAYKDNTYNNIIYSEYEKLRSRYDNFVKKLRKQKTPDAAINSYIDFKHEFLEDGRKKKKAVKAGKLSEDAMLKWIDKKNIERINKEDAILEGLNIR